MLRRPFFATLLLSLAAGALTCACSGGAFNARAKEASGDDDGDEEDAPGGQPAEVTGSYLTCGYLTEPDESDDGSTMIGCGAYEENRKLSADSRQFELSLFDANDREVDLQATGAVASSPWHVLAKLPGAAAQNGYLAMTVKEGAKSRVLRLATKDIQPAGTMLGTSADRDFSQDNGEALSEAAKINSFKFQAVWNGGVMGFITEGITPSSFCDAGGQIRTSLDSGSTAAIGFFGGLVPTQIMQESGTVDASSTVCLNDFTLLGVSGKSFAQSSVDDGCLFVRTGRDELLIISVARAGDSNLTLASLREFGERKACP